MDCGEDFGDAVEVDACKIAIVFVVINITAPMRPHRAGHFAADVADVSHHMHVGHGVVDASIYVGQQGDGIFIDTYTWI